MGFFLIGLLLFGLGLFCMMKPKSGASVLYWRSLEKAEEPSKVMVVCVRIVGACLILVGVLFLAMHLLIQLEQTGMID
jgi:uncharacterized membrane protein